ncbi:LYR motif-containing protein 4 [Nilaparvata lugens]|uniref:LYR motif-containing protein 4 n=1 Tax=Nilaparvata lugens TaxID=108931 RepID=UPI000B992E04|nr:LYR motif-containing protein 4 [Nilaparvata lugens]
MSISKLDMLRLYKTLLREAGKFQLYNYRMYALRRIKEGFRENKNITGSEINTKYEEGRNILEVIKRQVIVGNLYVPPKLVIEQ